MARIILLSLLTFLPIIVHSATIKLSSGDTINAEIIEQTDTCVRVKHSVLGVLTIEKKQIAVIDNLKTIPTESQPIIVAETDEASDDHDKTTPTTYVYECDQFSFTARIEGEKAWLFLPDKTISLPHVPAASGVKFSDGNSLFWTKGNEAMLEVGSLSHQSCINNRAKAIWEHAKLNGVDFRAVGNEPGWDLQITAGDKIVFNSDYGQVTHIFSTPNPITDQTTQTTLYRASENGHSILITLVGTPCPDTMIDKVYETTVSVTLDGKIFNGCGKALH